MSLLLHYHPLSSFCHKALIALYENDVPFTPKIVDLADPGQRAEFLASWPIGKFLVLQDAARGRVIPESTIIIEYLEQHHPGKERLIPEDPEQARGTRLRDRFFDLYVHEPMQKIIGDRLQPEGARRAAGSRTLFFDVPRLMQLAVALHLGHYKGNQSHETNPDFYRAGCDQRHRDRCSCQL